MTRIRRHAQQLTRHNGGKKRFYFVPWTKNEKRKLVKAGRAFPLTDAIKDIFRRLKNNQEEMNIKSEYIFCKEDGSCINTFNYERNVNKLFKLMGFEGHNNHILRRSLNSNVFIPLGIPATERARMLGHSVETNLRFYSYADKDTNDSICALLNEANKVKKNSKITGT